MLLLVFAALLLVYLVTNFGVVFKAVVPYWRNNHCLNVSIVMLLLIVVVGYVVTHPNSTELIGAVTENIYRERNTDLSSGFA